VVGVAFFGKNVVYGQQISDNNIPVIEMVGNTTLLTQWSIENINQSGFRKEVTSLFETIKNDLHFPDRQMSLVLPSDWLHYYTLLVDQALEPDDQRAYLRWEFRQRLGDLSSLFHPQFYPMSSADGYRTVVTVAVPENLVPVLKNAGDTVHFEVNSIELSPFSTLTNIPDTVPTGCLCKFYANTIEITTFEDRIFVGSALFSINEDAELSMIRSSGSESAAKELQAVLSALLSQESGGMPVFIYGTALPESIQLLAESDDNVSYIQPFEDFRVNFRKSSSTDVMQEAQYAEVAGTIRQALGDSV